MLKKIFSYIIPLTIYQTKSALSKSIEVTWTNGELVMDSQSTNYSYGSLQRILRLGLKNIGYKKIMSMEHVLVLGVAGGSVIKTLVEEIKYKGKITGVEIDPEIITIANAYFDLNKTKNLTIVIEDAFVFVLKTPTKYDLIIIDIFQDTTMPNFLFEPFFTNRVCSLLKSHGFILFNTMLLDENQNQRNKKYVTEFYKNQFKIRTIPRVEVHNELIVIEKIA
ncbi:methyltransferase domain-containing protein [Flavobacterium sp. RSP49]|uniref:spermidine synthase n=1 Tax=Flavobacterium sp. RSP49 TaxID=2497487 RepID=UPI000F833DC3|nr:fused MFS/spermidine synthase [Flavobacterium sp. RSP49]RTZ03391.1 methyltransferase domain-containing protein [Flavobacterium sp. RSP49]